MVCVCVPVYRLRCHANQRRGRIAVEAQQRFWLAVPLVKLSHTHTHTYKAKAAQQQQQEEKEIVKQKQQRK